MVSARQSRHLANTCELAAIECLTSVATQRKRQNYENSFVSRKAATHHCLTSPLGGISPEFLDETCNSKTRGMGLLYGDPNFNRFRLIHPCDGQTDGQTDGFAIAYKVKLHLFDQLQISCRFVVQQILNKSICCGFAVRLRRFVVDLPQICCRSCGLGVDFLPINRVARFPKPKYGRFFGPGNGCPMATNVVLIVVIILLLGVLVVVIRFSQVSCP